VDFDRYLDELGRHGALLHRSAGSAGLDAPVPSCAGWTVRRLLTHTTKVHHWATAILGGAEPAAVGFEAPDDGQLDAVYDDGLSALLRALRTAPDGRGAWTMYPAASGRMFWARRQAHETAIHRLDAELAAGYGVADFEPDFAADGIDELLVGMGPGRFTDLPVDSRRTISLMPLDVNESWTVTVSPAGFRAESSLAGGSDSADLRVFGMASDLYRWVWNRADGSEVSLRGDLSLADLWRQNLRVGAR